MFGYKQKNILKKVLKFFWNHATVVYKLRGNRSLKKLFVENKKREHFLTSQAGNLFER